VFGDEKKELINGSDATTKPERPFFRSFRFFMGLSTILYSLTGEINNSAASEWQIFGNAKTERTWVCRFGSHPFYAFLNNAI
jgi:hypothetical protein